MRIGSMELLLVFAIVLILFGPSQLPRLGKLFGKGVKGFRDGLEAETPADAGDEREGNR